MGTWSDDEKFREREREVAFSLGVQSCDAEIAALKADLTAHKRALAAGPAALVYRSCSCCWLVERAQEAAMKEGK